MSEMYSWLFTVLYVLAWVFGIWGFVSTRLDDEELRAKGIGLLLAAIFVILAAIYFKSLVLAGVQP
jgi:hypothetical protein